MKHWPAGRTEFNPALESNPLWGVWLHFGHRVGAVLVSIVLLSAVYDGRLVEALMLAHLMRVHERVGDGMRGSSDGVHERAEEEAVCSSE